MAFSGEPREIRACARLCAVVRAPESDSMGPFRVYSADFSPRRAGAGPFADAGPDFVIESPPAEHKAMASALKHQLLVLPIRR
jgi:hypothetical protein